MKPKLAFIDTSWAINSYRKKTGHYGAIPYYRLIKPMENLKEWFDIDFWGKTWFEKFKTGEEAYIYMAQNYDLIFSKHIDNGAAGSNLLAMADHFGKKVVVDLDDDYLNIRKDNPAHDSYAKLKGGRYFLGSFITLASGITVSTQPLKEVYAQMQYANPNIDVLPNCNDVNDWKFPRRIWKDDKIRIGYMGSITHNDDLELIWEPIAQILEKYPKVRFEICGAIDPKDIKDVMGKIQSFVKGNILDQLWFYGGTQSWYGFPQHLFSMGWDIGIAPLVDEPFNHGKSHIKWYDYTMVGIPTIASKVYPYFMEIQGTKTIEHEKTGLLVDKQQEWFTLIERLVLNPTQRRQIADDAYEYIRDNWQIRQHVYKWKEAFEKYL